MLLLKIIISPTRTEMLQSSSLHYVGSTYKNFLYEGVSKSFRTGRMEREM